MITIRNFDKHDGEAVTRLVHEAWGEYESQIPGWSLLSPRLKGLVEQASDSEVIIAESNGEIAGVVGYVRPNKPKPDFFLPEWPIIRLLSVQPKMRGNGIGKRPAEECILRAVRDKAPLIALHTTPVMAHAQSLYRNLGFQLYRELPPMFGVEYAVFTKRLSF